MAAMAEKYRGSRLQPSGTGGKLAQVATAAAARYRQALEAYALHEAAASAFQIIDAANEFIAERAPWTLAKDPTNAQALDEVLFEVAEAIRIAAVLLTPVMPASCAEIRRRVG